MFVISRIEQYKFSDCAAVYAESNRTLARYDNPDYRPDRTADNRYLVAPSFDGGIESYILAKKKEYRCRLSIDPSLPLNKQTNCFCQALFTASPEVLQQLSAPQKEEYFLHCLSFFKEEFPSVEIVSAVVHMDERTEHLHVNFLPIIRKENSKGKLKTVFSSSDLFDGKDFFTKYQDRFYEYMKERYPQIALERKGDVHQDHLTVREYKQVQSAIEDAKEELEDINKICAEKVSSASPTLQMKIENGDLRRKNQKLEKEINYYRKFYDLLLRRFPQLKPIFELFNKVRDMGPRNVER